MIYICVPHAVLSSPTNLTAIQEGPTSVRVSWCPPIPLGDTTGYKIYNCGTNCSSVDIRGRNTDDYLLTGLQNGVTYTISIASTSVRPQHLPSDNITAEEIGLGENSLC